MKRNMGLNHCFINKDKNITKHLGANIYKELKTIHNKDVVILNGDNYSSIVIMNKTGYIKKIEIMIEGRIKNGIYAEADDTTMKDFKRFQDFLRQHFKKHEHYIEIYEATKMYGTTKTHKFGSTDKIKLTKLKFCPIIDQTMTYT